MQQPAMILTDERTGAVARWRWLTQADRPAPRIELYPSPEAMMDEHAPPIFDLCVYDHATGTTEPYTAETLAAKVEEWSAAQVEEAAR